MDRSLGFQAQAWKHTPANSLCKFGRWYAELYGVSAIGRAESHFFNLVVRIPLIYVSISPPNDGDRPSRYNSNGGHEILTKDASFHSTCLALIASTSFAAGL